MQAQVTALNTQLAEMVNMHKSVDPSGFNRLAKAAEANSRTFRSAAASTGLFETQQVRVNSATDEYVKKLNAQKLSFRDMMKARKVATAAYREQLAMENMVVRKNPASSMHGKDIFDVTYPKAYEHAMDSAGNKLRWFNAQLKSGAHEMVNWGKNTQWSGRQIMVGFTMPIAAFGAAAGVLAYKVDKEFTRIAKVYDTQADKLQDLAAWEAETAQLRADGYNTARLAAREYQSAINDTLQVQGELAAVGLTGMELQKQTAEVMRIATLGELDMATATEANIALGSIWKMNSQELAETFNYLNATENATSLTTQDFATAIPVASAAVKSFGGDIKELGILMTAMKEQGINASEGANALKATMQRLSRPSKQIQAEFQKLTGTSIVELVDGSNGLIDIFTKINDVTKDLDQNAKRDVFAGLFGSYQVARMTALAEGMGNLQDGVGQVSKAAEVAGMSAGDLADVAQGEIDALQKSVSGRFKSALEEVKIILAEVGLPFLQIGTAILETVAKIGGAFNDLPGPIKVFVGLIAGAAALAGPLVMLTGLFANLGGQALKTVAGIITVFGKMTGTMQIADKQSRIYAKAAQMSENQHLENTKAVQSLTATMEKLVNAQIAANTESQKEAAKAKVNIRLSAERKAMEDERIRQMQIQNRLMSEYAMLTGTAKKGVVEFFAPGTNQPISEAEARALAARDVDETRAAEAAYYANQKANAEERTKVAAVGAQKAMDRQRVAMVGGAVAAGAMSLSMAAMMMPLGETATKVAQLTMVFTMVGPAAWGLVRATVAAAAAAGQYAKNMWSGAGAATAASATTKGSLLGGLKGLATKANLWSLAIVAAGAAAYFVWDYFRDIRKEQERIDRNAGALLGQTERWAAATGRVFDGYKKLALVNKEGLDTTDIAKRVEFYKSDEEKDKTNAFNDMSDAEKETTISGKYIDMVQGMGMSAAEAKKELIAFLIATGETAIGASVAVRDFTDSLDATGIAVMNSSEWRREYENTMETFNGITASFDFFDPMGDLEKNEKRLEGFAKQSGEMYAQAFYTGTAGDRTALKKQLEEQVLGPWNDMQKRLSSSEMSESMFANMGIDKAEMDEILSSGEALRTYYMSLDKDKREWFRGLSGISGTIEQAEKLERIIVGPIAKAIGVANEDADTLGELFGDAALQAATIADRVGGETSTVLEQGILEFGTKFEEVFGQVYSSDSLKALEAELTNLQSITPGELEEMDEDEQKAIKERKAALQELVAAAYLYGDALGIKPGDTNFEQIMNLMNGTQTEAAKAAAEVKKVKVNLESLPSRKSIKIDVDVQRDMMKNAWGEVMQDTADIFNDDFDNRMQASQDRTKSYWDGRKSALDAEMDRRSEGLDAKWEKRKDGAEKYWDARIDAVNKAIEAEEKAEEKRQRMFEAEIERLNRFAEIANKDIDFNVALNSGNLDEAAKIANDIQAEESNFRLDDAAAASQRQSDRKVDTLGNKAEDLEAQKDAAMKAMEKREKAEKAHLDKISDMRKNALEKDADAAIKANEAMWEEEKKAHDASIELLLSGVARSEKELKSMIEAAGLDYDVFRKSLKDKGLEVNQFIGKTLDQEINKAATRMRSDAVWGELGQDAMRKMITSMGFKNIPQFKHFIRTGEMKDFLEENEKRAQSRTQQVPADDKTGPQITQHEGGWAGKKDSRKGVARTYRGLHPSEVMIRAQKGEFVVSRDVAQEHGPLLEALNSTGKLPHNRATARAKKRGLGGAGGGSMAGSFGGAIIRSLMHGIVKNIGEKAEQAKKMAKTSGGSGRAFPGKYIPGKGGWQKPSIPGLGWSNTHDYRAATGTPIFAPSDGVITKSHAITSGGSPGNGLYPVPYRSYGETIQIRMADGNLMNFAHLMPGGRYVSAGQRVKGGALIGRTGNTGNSTGPHLHMDIGGNENARGYLASRGIALAKGAANVNFDNVPAILHKNEAVLTEDINRQFKQGVANFANGGGNEYTFIVNPSEGMDEEALANKVIKKWKAEEARKPQSRTVGRRL